MYILFLRSNKDGMDDEIGPGGSHEYHHNHIETPQLAQPKQEIAIAPMVRHNVRQSELNEWYKRYPYVKECTKKATTRDRRLFFLKNPRNTSSSV